jgi:hypothetical protein
VPGRGVRAAIDSSTVASAQEPLSQTSRATTSGRLSVGSMRICVGFPRPRFCHRQDPSSFPTLHLGCVDTDYTPRWRPAQPADPTAMQADLTLSPDATIREWPRLRWARNGILLREQNSFLFLTLDAWSEPLDCMHAIWFHRCSRYPCSCVVTVQGCEEPDHTENTLLVLTR